MFNYSGIQFVKPKRRAVVIGGGFIGLETAENLVHAGFEVTLVEMLDQVLAPLDREFAVLVEERLKRHGVRLALGDGVAGFAQLEGGGVEVKTKSGKAYPAEVVILALGVRPDTALAKAAGLEIGERGGIRVDDQMRTSDPDIFAVGDAIEVKDWVTGQWSLVALAGPANRQGRIAADVIAGRDSRYRGTQGTSIIGLFGGAAAWTGVSEKTLKRLGDTDYEKIYLFPNSHAGYYPGAKMLGMKVLFRKSDGRLLGAQCLGEDGPAVDKRISALAMALQMRATIHDLEESELCYAPQFGSAKDPVNFAGMVAANVLERRHAARALGRDRGRLPPRRARAVELVLETRPGRRQHPAPPAAGAARRAAEGPGDPHHLPVRGRAYYATRILPRTDSGAGSLRRHAVAGDLRPVTRGARQRAAPVGLRPRSSGGRSDERSRRRATDHARHQGAFPGPAEQVSPRIDRVRLNVAYLAPAFAVFTWYRRLVLAAHDITYTNYWVALIEALIPARSSCSEGCSTSAATRSEALIYPTLYKTVVFSLLVGAFTVVEDAFRGLWTGEGLLEGGLELLRGRASSSCSPVA